MMLVRKKCNHSTGHVRNASKSINTYIMSKQAKLGDPTDFSYRIDKVIKVVDGDTIDVMIDLGFDIKYKSRVRLFGIDTPESRTRDLTEKKYGLLSKKYLQSALANGSKKIIKTHKDQETGKFGRILGEIFVDGKNINMETVSYTHLTLPTILLV